MSSKHTELSSIEEELSDQAVVLRASVVNIAAKFAQGTPDEDKERVKLENFIRLLLQHHLKSLSHCVKLLVMGIIKGEIPRATRVLTTHLGTLMAGQVVMGQERKAIYEGRESTALVFPEIPLPVADADTEAPQDGTPA